MTARRHGEAGVTLIEVLVSLAIFAVIGIAGLTVLDTVARTGERTDGRLDRLAEIDRAFLVIRRDLAQISGLDTRLNEDGLAFRRLDAEGSFAVRYHADDTDLTREIRRSDPTPMDQLLLTGVRDVQWRLLDGAKRWAPLWPPEGVSSPQRPLAAELTLEVTRNGMDLPQSVTRIFALPAGQGR